MKNKKIILQIISVLCLVGIIICMVIIIHNQKRLMQLNNNVNSTKQNTNNTIKTPSKTEETNNDVQEEKQESSKNNKSETISPNNKPITKTDSNSKSNNSNDNIQNSSSNLNSSDNNIEETNVDDLVISYFKETKEKLENSNLRESAKQNFITIVDFLFYDGKIKGHTFNELSNKAKLQVLKLALTIDSYVDKYFPNYKETIKITTGKVCTNIKAKVIEKYLNITTTICNNDTDTCNQAKNDFQNMKKSFSITWDLIKEIAKSGTTHLKEWYEIYSGK